MLLVRNRHTFRGKAIFGEFHLIFLETRRNDAVREFEKKVWKQGFKNDKTRKYLWIHMLKCFEFIQVRLDNEGTISFQNDTIFFYFHPVSKLVYSFYLFIFEIIWILASSWLKRLKEMKIIIILFYFKINSIFGSTWLDLWTFSMYIFSVQTVIPPI